MVNLFKYINRITILVVKALLYRNGKLSTKKLAFVGTGGVWAGKGIIAFYYALQQKNWSFILEQYKFEGIMVGVFAGFLTAELLAEIRKYFENKNKENVK